MTSLSNPMVEAVTLLAVMREVGLHVRLDDGGQLRVGPPSMLWPYDVEYIKELKPALVSLLAAEAAPAVRSTADLTQPPSVRPERDMAHCGACSHFLPDSINPAQGVGRCGVTGAGPPSVASGDDAACYPMAPRQCPSYELRTTQR